MQKSKISPSGAIFPYYFKNGELFGIHLGSYFSNEDGVIAMMKAEGTFINQQHRRIGLWIDFYETKLTSRVIDELIEFLKAILPKITKLGLVGCSFWEKRRINKLIQQTEQLSKLPIKYYRDPEDAKTWLVSEYE